MSKLFKGVRIGAAAILPAVFLFGLASDDTSSSNAAWFSFIVPATLCAVVAVGCLDGLRGVVPAALCCGVIFAFAAHVEHDDRPLPGCGSLTDMSCKNDADPQGGIGAAMVVFVGGGAAALLAGCSRKISAST